ncbi:hypothetical protein RRG08_009814 [Elysia crispata]|uniref:Uncharacterized protein n=1 Tax=Elysia crispata TaxID=231223 RepID=A0AAE1D9P1_9GAST|nr:hypothetical protein RRG08_009814 [Elysia crispata]
MLAYIVLSLALAVGTVLSADCSQDCKAEFWDNAPKNVPSQICKAGQDWRKCLDGLLMARCSNVNYPQELNNAGSACNQPDPVPPSGVDCSEVSLCTLEDDINASDDDSEKCLLAKEWRTCLDHYNFDCSVTYPFELNQAEALYCDSADGTDCSEVSTCTLLDSIKGSKSKSERCELAREWRACLDIYNPHCSVTYPFELNEAEALNCYGTSDDDDVPSDDVDDAGNVGAGNGTDDAGTLDSTGGASAGNGTDNAGDAKDANKHAKGAKGDNAKKAKGHKGAKKAKDAKKAKGSKGTKDAKDPKDGDGDKSGDDGAQTCSARFGVCDDEYNDKIDAAEGIDKCIGSLGWISCYKTVTSKGCEDKQDELDAREAANCGKSID